MSNNTMEARILMYVNENFCPNIFGTVNVCGKVFDFLEEDEEIRIGNNPSPEEKKAAVLAVRAFERRKKIRPLMVAGI